MRAFEVTAPGVGGVVEVPDPTAGPGEVVVDVVRVGLCGTDVELFDGSMAYLATGRSWYPLRPGHEWWGRVGAVGDGVDDRWRGHAVTADTMLGCGVCPRCRAGRHHVCADLVEVGISQGMPGALAEQVVVPVRALLALPDGLSDAAAALVEPGGCAWRVVHEAGQVHPGQRVRVHGTGTIGLLAAQLAVAAGAEVSVVGVRPAQLELARSSLGLDAGPPAPASDARFDVVVDATTARDVPAAALTEVEPGGRLVLIGLAGEPSLLDTRAVVLADVTVVGVLGASAGLAPAADALSRGVVAAEPLVAGVVGLADVAAVLAGHRPDLAGGPPKVLVDPAR